MTKLLRKYLLIFLSIMILTYGCSPAAPPVSESPEPMSDLQPTPVQSSERVEGEETEFRKLIEANEITIFIRGLNKTGLVDQLKGPLPTTFFIPSDSAFRSIPNQNLQALLNDDDLLKELLVHHTVTGNFSLSDLQERNGLTNNLGEMLFITVENGDTFIDGARIVTADLELPFGVIHVIDRVLSPPG